MSWSHQPFLLYFSHAHIDGTGILRFKANQSVGRAMKKFRKEEIVVQDVAVHVKVLKPGSINGGPVDSSSPSIGSALTSSNA
jgi:hypothetical protein